MVRISVPQLRKKYRLRYDFWAKLTFLPSVSFFRVVNHFHPLLSWRLVFVIVARERKSRNKKAQRRWFRVDTMKNDGKPQEYGVKAEKKIEKPRMKPVPRGYIRFDLFVGTQSSLLSSSLLLLLLLVIRSLSNLENHDFRRSKITRDYPTDGRTDGRTDRPTDGRTDGPTDRRTDRPMDRPTQWLIESLSHYKNHYWEF